MLRRLLLWILCIAATAAPAQDPSALSDTDLQRAIVAALRSADPARAVELATEQLARNEREHGPVSMPTATSLTYLSLAHRNLDQFDEAAAYGRRVLTAMLELRGPDHTDTATALHNLAGIQRERGDAVTAELGLRRALEIRRDVLGDEHFAVASTRNSLGQLDLQQGDPLTAVEEFDAALAIMVPRLGDDQDDVLKIRRARAQAITELGRVDEAAEEVAAVIAALEAQDPRDDARIASAIAQRADLLARAGDVDAAIDAWRASIALRAKITTEPQVEVVRARLDIAHHAGDRAEAARALREAQTAFGNRHPVTLDARVTAAFGRLDDGDPDAALALLATASADHDSIRAQAGRGLRRATAQVRSPEPALALAHFRRGDLEASWAACERARAGVLRRMISGPGAPDVTLDDLRGHLDGRTAVVGWLVVADRRRFVARLAWSVGIDGSLRVVELGDDGRASVDRLRTRLATPPGPFDVVDPDAMADDERAVFDAWIAPHRDALVGAERVLVVGDGALQELPLATLRDAQGARLIDGVALQRVPSIGTWIALNARERTKRRTLLALGDPPFRDEHVGTTRAADPSELPRLPGTRAEVEGLRGYFASTTTLLGTDASEARLRELVTTEALADFDVVHFATHAAADPLRPQDSWIALAQTDLAAVERSLAEDTPAEDGLITVREVLADWTLDASLVTLSACNTSRGRDVPGEGVLGFAHAFLSRGSSAMLASMWEIDDVATAHLMDAFYAHWTRDDAPSAAECLRVAQRAVRDHVDEGGQRPWAHPYFWAAFVLWGDG